MLTWYIATGVETSPLLYAYLNITSGVCLLETLPLTYAYLEHNHWRVLTLKHHYWCMLTTNINTGVCLLKHHWHMLTWNIATGVCLLETSTLVYVSYKHHHRSKRMLTKTSLVYFSLETSPLAYAYFTTGVCLLETSPLAYAYYKHHHWRMFTTNITTGVWLLQT